MKRNDAKLVIILIGPPGSGKGTQAELLTERIGLYYLETSKILEKVIGKAKKGECVKIKGRKYSFEKEKGLWEKGILCSPPFVVYLIQEKIKELYQRGENLLLAGSPRTLYEGKNLMPFLERLYGKKNIKVILMKVSATQSIFRNSHRRICELMRHPIIYTPETKNLKICSLDGSRLMKREKLDELETIKVRLKEYEERTMPLISYLKKAGFSVKEINGEGTVAEVFTRSLKALS